MWHFFYEKKTSDINILTVFRLTVFFINNIKVHSFTSLASVGGVRLFKVMLVGTGVQLNTPMHILLSNEI